MKEWSRVSPFENRFSKGLQGLPLLEGAAAAFECHTRHRYYGGDHVIVIGNVERYHHAAEREPLVFHRGRYGLAGA